MRKHRPVAVPEVSVSLVFLRGGLACGRWSGLLHSLVPEAHVGVGTVPPDAAGVRGPGGPPAAAHRSPHRAAHSVLWGQHTKPEDTLSQITIYDFLR